MAITLLMLMAEVCDQVAGVWDVQFVSLALVAYIHATLVGDFPAPIFVPEVCFCAALQGCEFLFELPCRSFRCNSPKNGARIVFDYVTNQDTEARECAGQGGYHHPRNA